MQELKDVLSKIDALQGEFLKLSPLPKENERKLWEKFRLEWNYNSNHIEGNTLTYGQTKLLLFFDKTTGDHEMREYEEMKAHDVAIEIVRRYAAEENRELSENDIREWNKLILVRPFWGEATTPDGQQTRKLIEPGKYKSTPNSVRLSNGEIFNYALPEETPVLMRQLMEWYRSNSAGEKLHMVEVAALLHYKFVRIHPFDDSNGRTARLLMNYHLLKNGYPPIVIKSSDKKNYLFALNKADVGDEEAFVRYVADNLIWSLEISLKAAKGLNIEEDDDLNKKISVWARSHANSKSISIVSFESIQEAYSTNLLKFYELFLKEFQQFDNGFLSKSAIVKGNGLSQDVTKDTLPNLRLFFEQLFHLGMEDKDFVSKGQRWVIRISYNTLRARPREGTSVAINLITSFLNTYYEVGISISGNQVEPLNDTIAKVDYFDKISVSDIESAIKKCKATFFKCIAEL